MPEELAPEQNQDTPEAPEEAAPQGTPADQPASEDTNWQERYTNLQPEYTRATQEAAQYRQIIDLARQGDPEAIAALGFDLAETDTEDEQEYDDPDDRLSRIEQVLFERLEQEQEAQQEQQWIEEADKRVTAQVAELAKQHGQLSDEDIDYLLDLAPLDNEGYPDLTVAFQRDQQRLEAKRESWVSGKRKAQRVGSGASASNQPDLDDPEQRRAYLARRVSEEEVI